MRRAVAMGLPSSLTATMPAFFIAAISARASPLLPMDAAPIGQTRTAPWDAARSTMPRVTEALSLTGCVLGMQQTAVNPPRAAASVPVSIVSESSWPGSRRWQWRSMKPGATIRPLASKISAPSAERFAPTREMQSPSRRTSSGASVLVAGSRTRPFLISSIRAVLCGMGRVHGSAADQVIEKRHAHGEAVGHLLEDAGLRAVGNSGIDFEAANHRAGVQHEGVGAREAQALGRELIAEDVFLGGERGLVKALGLHAQDHDDVGAIERVFDAGGAAQARGHIFEFARHPHRGAAERDARAELAEQMNIRAGHAAVENVAQDRDVPAVEAALAIADGERVEKRLGGMFVRAIARVQHGNFEALGDEFRRAGRAVADHDAVGTHGFDGAHGVDQRLALFQAGGFRLEGHRIGAEARRGCGEADARARGRLEERDCDCLAA